MTEFRSQVRSIDDLHGPAGRLEAVLNTGRPGATMAAIVCHPHPAGGGTMHNKVVYHAMKVLSGFGIPVLRFNFRSVGLSEGVHDDGRGEQDDVRAAADWMARTYSRPLLFCGFSFGAHVGLRATCDDDRFVGLIALGLPIEAGGRYYHYDFLDRCAAPKLFITGGQDAFAPAARRAAVLAQAPEPKSIVSIPEADHFFQGTPASPQPKLAEMQGVLRSWISTQFSLAEEAP